MAANLESDIDQLYKLPVTDFTKARNALAKDLAGEARAKVRALGKPSVPAWAVNQLYWQDRAAYESLVKAAEQLRTAHRAVISGRKADLRKPTEAHRAAVQKGLQKVRAILQQSSLSESSATLNAVTRTLEALPTSGPPGRLATPLQPAGFDILAGVKPRADLRLVDFPPSRKALPPSRDASARLAVPVGVGGRRGRVVPRAEADSRTPTGPSARELARAKAAVGAARQAAEKAQKALETATRHANAARVDEARHRAALDRAVQTRHARERERAELTTAAENAAASVTDAERALALMK
jgi:hypothetical protein